MLNKYFFSIMGALPNWVGALPCLRQPNVLDWVSVYLIFVVIKSWVKIMAWCKLWFSLNGLYSIASADRLGSQGQIHSAQSYVFLKKKDSTNFSTREKVTPYAYIQYLWLQCRKLIRNTGFCLVLWFKYMKYAEAGMKGTKIQKIFFGISIPFQSTALLTDGF